MPHLSPGLRFLSLVLPCLLAGSAGAQCILTNPSFEMGGSGGQVFQGWEQFGVVGSVGDALHGAAAARVTGPNWGGWDVSGYWQPHDCAPGEQFLVTGHVRHPSVNPLTGDCVAIVNVEWRNSAGDLIDYDTFAVADADAEPDRFVPFSMTSSPAPGGTAQARILLGVLQSPADPAPDVDYDQITFQSLAFADDPENQWADFPGDRAVAFAGRSWRVKGPGYYGPGPNVFSDAADCVWVDGGGRLHLTLSLDGGTWRSTEVVAEEALGYGDYILTTESDLDAIDPQAVLGLFLWEYGPCWSDGYTSWNAFNEIDIEYSRWGDPNAQPVQFVAQPWDYPGNRVRFDAAFAPGETTSHAMRWLPDRVEYRVWRGGPADEQPANLIGAWTYAGPHIPRPEQPRLHLNLWKLAGTPAADQEIVFSDFNFVPQGGATGVPIGSPETTPGSRGQILEAAPNPFNPSTTVAFELDGDAAVTLAVYDVTGRLVRTVTTAALPAGRHTATWDGRGDDGRPAASGTYLFRLEGDGLASTRRVTLIK